MAELFRVSKKCLDCGDSYAGVVSRVYFITVSKAFPSSNYQTLLYFSIIYEAFQMHIPLLYHIQGVSYQQEASFSELLKLSKMLSVPIWSL